MPSPLEEYKKDVASKSASKTKTSKMVWILSVTVTLAVVAGIVYLLIQDKNSKADLEQSAVKRVTDFYTELANQTNTNKSWPAFIDEYTIDSAKEDVSTTGVFLIDSTKKGGQYLVKITSPFKTGVFNITSDTAEILVDFDLNQRQIGGQEKNFSARKYLLLKRVGDKWMISKITDRSERFDVTTKK